jgi:TnpA family transposase
MKSRIQWQFSQEQLALIETKHKKNRLYYALQLKYYETHLRFFNDSSALSSKTVYQVARTLGVSGKIKPIPPKTNATYRQEIRDYFQTHVISAKDESTIKNWLLESVFPQEYLSLSQLKEKVIGFLNTQKIEIFSEKALERVIKSAQYQHEQLLFKAINNGLNNETKAYLDGLLLLKENSSRLAWIKRWAGGLALNSILDEANKLKALRLMVLPECIGDIPNKALQSYYRNVCTKYPRAIKEMPEIHRYALLAVFAWVRQRQIADNMAELLIRLTHKFVNAGKNKLIKEVSQVAEVKRGCNRKQLLRLLVLTIFKHEDEVIKQAIYPVTPKTQLKEAIYEDDSKDYSYASLIHERARNSYLHHYRRMLFPILELLTFKSNNTYYQPIIEALQLIQANLESGSTYYATDGDVPINGAVKKSHQSWVLENSEQGIRVNRINYEMCVLRNLRSKLRVKEVWIEGCYQYRNPEEDLPPDFESHRDYYYHMLDKPQNAKRFVRKLKKELSSHLNTLNKGIIHNKSVQILKKPSGHIKVAKLKEQPPPSQLEAIKQEVFKRWPNTSLLDVLKETDLFVDFLSAFMPSGPKEGLDKNILRKRLLLCILGYGTNTGLKNISVGNEEANYHELKHVKLRYFDPDNFREATRRVVNQLFKIRAPALWESCTTAVASDSKLFQAADQNLLSQWHPRYHKKGVMVYWHVDTKSVCIYSQLKSCASSEVASMIEGVLRHCSDMAIEKNYVDTHGASEIGFAFSYLLDFDLLPRLKNIHNQRLATVSIADAQQHANIASILSYPINWDAIESQYDQIIKYTTALKLGTANSETIMKRFTRDNQQHPTYKALKELGRAVKSIFICRYLSSEALRQEIHEGLNVVERWNSVNDFIFYGKTGPMHSNKPGELELAMLCLHLLQVSMVYINTLMLQQVIQESDWLSKMQLEDKRAVTPLLHEHINPYGIFLLNLDERLAIHHPILKEAA